MFCAVTVVTDGGSEEGPEAGIPILATASSADGHLKLWRLDPRPEKVVRHPPPPPVLPLPCQYFCNMNGNDKNFMIREIFMADVVPCKILEP